MSEEKNSRSRLFDPHLEFHKLPIFLTVFGFFVIVIVSSLLFIFLTSELEVGSGYKSINKLVEVYKVPVGLVAALVSITAIIGMFHRSAQTKEQINLANEQNNFSNYFKHFEEFEKHLSVLEKDYFFKVYGAKHLHALIFQDPMKGKLYISERFNEICEKNFGKVEECIRLLDSDDAVVRLNALTTITHVFKSICDYYYIDIESVNPECVEYNGKEFKLMNSSAGCTLKSISDLAKIIINIIEFRFYNDKREFYRIHSIANLDVKNIPKEYYPIQDEVPKLDWRLVTPDVVQVRKVHR